MENNDIINKFFDKRLITAPRTKESYRRGITLFFETINKKPETYLNNGNDYEEDVGKFYLSLEKRSPLTIRTYINAVKQFMTAMDKTTRQLEVWNTISSRLRGADRVSEEMALDQQDLRNILQYSNICSKAICMMMASSGCRIGEIVQLLPEDIHEGEKPARIVFRAEITKKKRMRTSFITPEAVSAYKAWGRVRDEWLLNAVNRAVCSIEKNPKMKKLNKNPDDKRVFPMTTVNVRVMWDTMVRKAGYDERDTKTQRLKVHPHSLRKFFRSYLGNVDLAEHLLGHRGYLSTYRAYNEKGLAKAYEKYMGNVSIFELQPDLTDVNEQLKGKDEEIFSLKKEMKVLMERQERLEMLGNRFTKILGEEDVQKFLIQKMKKLA